MSAMQVAAIGFPGALFLDWFFAGTDPFTADNMAGTVVCGVIIFVMAWLIDRMRRERG